MGYYNNKIVEKYVIYNRLTNSTRATFDKHQAFASEYETVRVVTSPNFDSTVPYLARQDYARKKILIDRLENDPTNQSDFISTMIEYSSVVRKHFPDTKINESLVDVNLVSPLNYPAPKPSTELVSYVAEKVSEMSVGDFTTFATAIVNYEPLSLLVIQPAIVSGIGYAAFASSIGVFNSKGLKYVLKCALDQLLKEYNKFPRNIINFFKKIPLPFGPTTLSYVLHFVIYYVPLIIVLCWRIMK